MNILTAENVSFDLRSLKFDEIIEYCLDNNIFVLNAENYEAFVEYFKIWKKAISKSIILKDNYEWHHFIPKKLGGGQELENYIPILLTEHFRCHQLLPKITPIPNKHKMDKALKLMMDTRNGIVYSPEEYETSKILASQYMSILLKERSLRRELWQQSEEFEQLSNSGLLWAQSEEGRSFFRLNAKKLASEGRLFMQSNEGKKFMSQLKIERGKLGILPQQSADARAKKSKEMLELSELGLLWQQSQEGRQFFRELNLKFLKEGKHPSQQLEIREYLSNIMTRKAENNELWNQLPEGRDRCSKNMKKLCAEGQMWAQTSKGRKSISERLKINNPRWNPETAKKFSNSRTYLFKIEAEGEQIQWCRGTSNLFKLTKSARRKIGKVNEILSIGNYKIQRLPNTKEWIEFFETLGG